MRDERPAHQTAPRHLLEPTGPVGRLLPGDQQHPLSTGDEDHAAQGPAVVVAAARAAGNCMSRVQAIPVNGHGQHQ
jgi:hypothetical protein